MGAIDAQALGQPTRHRLSVQAFQQLADGGALPADVRVELIDGEVIEMPPQKSRHASAVNRLVQRLARLVGEQAFVSCQTPLVLGPHSQPEPDLMLLRPRTDAYAGALPTAADVLLLIEVGDATARFDRTVKLPLYARHGIPAVWLLDLEAQRLRCHSEPAGDEYARLTTHAAPAALPLPGLPGLDGLALDLSGLLD